MMTEDECRAALKGHIAAERARDLDGIMETVSDDVYFIIPGFELRGKPAVRALYAQAMPNLTEANADEYLRAMDDPAVATWGPELLILAYDTSYPLHYGMFVVTHFSQGKVKSEHTFINVTPNSASAQPQLGAFASVPGVTPVKPLPGSYIRV